MNIQAMLLAAGFGTRLRPYSLIRPKPLFPVCNHPLLEIILRQLRQAGCRRVVVNCHHLAGQIGRAVAGMPEVLLQREEEILGTGGSLRQALPGFTDRPVLVVNGDILHTVDLAALYRHHCRSGNLVTLAMHHLPRFNTVAVAGDRVLGFRDHGADRLLAFTGIHVVEPAVLEQIPAGRFFHIIDLYGQLALRGRVGLMRVDGAFWHDIGTPEDYLEVHRRILVDRHGPAWLHPEQGAWCIHPSAEIGTGVRLRGWGAIGAGCRVGAGAILEDCVVWSGTTVDAGKQRRLAILSGRDDRDRQSS